MCNISTSKIFELMHLKFAFSIKAGPKIPPRWYPSPPDADVGLQRWQGNMPTTLLGKAGKEGVINLEEFSLMLQLFEIYQ